MSTVTVTEEMDLGSCWNRIHSIAQRMNLKLELVGDGYEPNPDKWGHMLLELPSDHNQTIKLICDIVNSERPDEIEVINDGKTLFMWWD